MSQQNFCSSCYLTCPFSHERKEVRVFFYIPDEVELKNIVDNFQIEYINTKKYQEFWVITCTPKNPATLVTEYCYACAQRQNVLIKLLKNKTSASHAASQSQGRSEIVSKH
jgi:hypothetical protein